MYHHLGVGDQVICCAIISTIRNLQTKTTRL